ncbi:MAG: hypothetical protein RL748_2284 [Pseudomonadota bacterium]|jgi:hypothetical protein
MEISLGSKYLLADVTAAVDKTGQEHLLIVVKGSWSFASGRVARPCQAMPLQYGDVFVGEAGLSAPLYESDFVLKKLRCDVIFNAKAYAPDNEPVTELEAGFSIGNVQKTLRVVGNRVWQNGQPSAPQAFFEMPLHFGLAFGGEREVNAEQKINECYQQNPVGRGFSSDEQALEGKLLPNLEAIEQRINRTNLAWQPAALSATARSWLPRRQFGGTYDANWKRNIFPFLPEDFDERFNQCAPEDQQIAFPQGGEEVVLTNLMRGRLEARFQLPRLNKLPIKVLMSNYTVEEPQVLVDTLYFEPDKASVTAVWRASIPMKRGILDFKAIAIGGICKNWWAAKIMGRDGCENCAKQHATSADAPSEDDCAQETIKMATDEGHA